MESEATRKQKFRIQLLKIAEYVLFFGTIVGCFGILFGKINFWVLEKCLQRGYSLNRFLNINVSGRLFNFPFATIPRFFAIHVFNVFFAHHYFRKLIVITGLLLVAYFVISVLNKYQGVMTPFIDDITQLRFKRRIKKILNYTKIRKEDKSLYKAIRTLQVSCITIAKDNDKDSEFYNRSIDITFKRPFNKAVDGELEHHVDGLDVILSGVDEQFTFGKLQAGTRKFSYSSSVELDKSDLQLFKRKSDKTTDNAAADKLVEEQPKQNVTFSAEQFLPKVADKADKIKDKAKGYLDVLENTLKNFLMGSGYQVTLEKRNLGATIAEFTYTYEVRKNAVPITELNRKLSEEQKINGIVGFKIPYLTVQVPLPDNLMQPLDSIYMFEHAFLPYQDEEVKPVGVLKNTATSVLQGITGMSPSGEILKVELDALPHLIIAGMTGSGKSVAINAFLASVMYHSTPQEVQFFIVDPKKVEFKRYNSLPYMMAQTITDMDEAYIALRYLTELQDERYELMAKVGVQNLDQYNKLALKQGLKPMPKIICLIDEFSELYKQHNEVDVPVQSLGQKARACGIHLMIALQSPRKENLPGTIQANIASRWALKVADSMEANIMNAQGAERLRGEGDFIFKESSQSEALRGQGLYIDNQTLNNIFTYLTNNYPRANKLANVYVEFEKLYIKHHKNIKNRDDVLNADVVGDILDKYYKNNPEIAEKSLAELENPTTEQVDVLPDKKAEAQKRKVEMHNRIDAQKHERKAPVVSTHFDNENHLLIHNSMNKLGFTLRDMALYEKRLNYDEALFHMDNQELDLVAHFDTGSCYRFGARSNKDRITLKPKITPFSKGGSDRTHLIPIGYHGSENDSRLLIDFDSNLNRGIMNKFEKKYGNGTNKQAPILWCTRVKHLSDGVSIEYFIYNCKTKKVLHSKPFIDKRKFYWNVN